MIAKKTSNFSCTVVMIDNETTKMLFRFKANSTNTILIYYKLIVLFDSNSVSFNVSNVLLCFRFGFIVVRFAAALVAVFTPIIQTVYRRFTFTKKLYRLPRFTLGTKFASYIVSTVFTTRQQA